MAPTYSTDAWGQSSVSGGVIKRVRFMLGIAVLRLGERIRPRVFPREWDKYKPDMLISRRQRLAERQEAHRLTMEKLEKNGPLSAAEVVELSRHGRELINEAERLNAATMAALGIHEPPFQCPS